MWALVAASLVWLHRWIPAFLLAAFVLWLLFHERLEGDRGKSRLRRWRRVWPPRTLVLGALLLGETLAFSIADAPVLTKLLPVALDLLALSVLSFGNWWRLLQRLEPPGWPGSELSNSGPVSKKVAAERWA